MTSKFGDIELKISKVKQEMDYLKQELQYLENTDNTKEIILNDRDELIDYYEGKINKLQSIFHQSSEDNQNENRLQLFMKKSSIIRDRNNTLAIYDKKHFITKLDLDVYYFNFPYSIKVYTQ